ncbi:hypothetical protein GCM10027271_20700 [Saccharopolyspora gloriosae]|uniref:DUF397 domain-containing protein n=1 Tax=Saccharopolyspora gloriosae TaxID=455344 RepID=A0A840NH69_9PSEU|nr:DUF397 domain-containing protein [Saccharopolyspora gloriosae]MBB5067617.1 hypothetical protein [Saccharopolyspora gloriosae]
MEYLTGWRTSTRSTHQGQCVEVGFGSGRVGVRDTKDRPGGYFAVDPARWGDFLGVLKRGEFDR